MEPIRFGYSESLDASIHQDVELLASLTTIDELQNDSDELWTRFVSAGGDDSHSGASWGCVRYAARTILANKK